MASTAERDGEEKPSLFKLHKSEGKRLLKQGDVQGALQAFERAAEYQADERLQAKMEKMREFLKSEQAQEACESDMVEIGNGFYLCQAIERKLYAYQRMGLLWMWELHLKKRGGVLGDDMGLGKTIQVIAFLSGMFDSDMIKSVMIIMPVSLIANWKKEFAVWAPGIDVMGDDVLTGRMDPIRGKIEELERLLERAYQDKSELNKELCKWKEMTEDGAHGDSVQNEKCSSELGGEVKGQSFQELVDREFLNEKPKVENTTKVQELVSAHTVKLEKTGGSPNSQDVLWSSVQPRVQAFLQLIESSLAAGDIEQARQVEEDFKRQLSTVKEAALRATMEMKG
ncbi:hypothetical protein HPB52_004307 [Rhipicephalus sanguineus]|uniref:SNF2 N-terminal domain-containing protein n=1 Tax=Rhipicephalus sanguineus TaxID=34632 RepID=A0A9D4QH42_RHISA|nr:hypothetical protein HPB52_004307 [Rhipicephalus sanguineus]